MEIRPLFSVAGIGTSIACVNNGDIYLLDAGEGALARMFDMGLRPVKIRAICITHLHGDHINGLPSLIAYLSAQRKEAVDLIGPPGIKTYFDTLKNLGVLGSKAPGCVDVFEIPSWCDYQENIGGVTISTLQLEHRIACNGFLLQTPDRPGKVNVEKLAELGLKPGPVIGQIKAGKSVVVGGKIIAPTDITGPPQKGFSVAYCTDTMPCDNAVVLAQGADVLIHDSTCGDDDVAAAEAWAHSTARQAAEIAAKAGVKKLMLAHIGAGKDRGRLFAQATEVFQNVVII